MVVLIPLSSGLVFRPNRCTQSWKSQRLNPFIFRAGVQAERLAEIAAEAEVLIPLSSGLVFRRRSFRESNPSLGLNPFIFRAGVQAEKNQLGETVKCLNPFIFRAGVQACYQDRWPAVGAS